MRIALRLRQISARSLISVEEASAALWSSPPDRLVRSHDDRCPGPPVHAMLQRRGFAAEASPASQDEEEEQREIGTPRVRQLVDEIANLSLLDVSDLTTLLSKKLGVPMGGPAYGGFGGGFGGPAPAGPAAAAPDAAAAAAPPAEEKTEFDVKLTAFDAAAKIKVIKEVRAMTELGLKEAKELVEKAPVVVKSGLKKEEAEELMRKLEAAGGKVSLE